MSTAEPPQNQNIKQKSSINPDQLLSTLTYSYEKISKKKHFRFRGSNSQPSL